MARPERADGHGHGPFRVGPGRRVRRRNQARTVGGRPAGPRPSEPPPGGAAIRFAAGMNYPLDDFVIAIKECDAALRRSQQRGRYRIAEPLRAKNAPPVRRPKERKSGWPSIGWTTRFITSGSPPTPSRSSPPCATKNARPGPARWPPPAATTRRRGPRRSAIGSAPGPSWGGSVNGNG